MEYNGRSEQNDYDYPGEIMRFDLTHPHLEMEPVCDGVLIRLKDARITNEEHIRQIETDIMKLVQAEPGQTLFLDFEKVRFLSSAFLGCLIKLQTSVTQDRGFLKLRNLHPDIAKIFKVTGLQKLFTIETNK